MVVPTIPSALVGAKSAVEAGGILVRKGDGRVGELELVLLELLVERRQASIQSWLGGLSSISSSSSSSSVSSSSSELWLSVLLAAVDVEE
jgi:hypothetical protein